MQDDYFYPGGFHGQQVAGVFTIRPDSGFDPVRPWRLELLVNGTGPKPATVAFGLDYKIPDALVLMPSSEVEPEMPSLPGWVEVWSEAQLNIAILGVLRGEEDICLPAIFDSRTTRLPSGGLG